MFRSRVVVHDAEVARLARAEGHYDGVRKDLEERAKRMLSQAQEMAPVVTGDYREHLHVVTDVTSDGVRVMVGGASSHDYEVEDQHGVLARSLDAAGGT